MTLTNEVEVQAPFEGQWYVFWGGDSVEQNYHYGSEFAEARYAIDFCSADDVEKIRSMEDGTNEDFNGFGEPILAPADGKVVAGLKDAPDQTVLGKIPAESRLPKFKGHPWAYGNFVMLEHKRFYSILCHLRQDSLLVDIGDQVKTGQKIAECGNSGRTTAPHLHFHLQDSNFYNAQRQGLKPIMKDVWVKREETKWQLKDRHFAVKGDIISTYEPS